MRILFDLVHPADAHMFRHVIRSLDAEGVATHVVSRRKDVLEDLLDAYGIAHVPVGASGRKTRAGQAEELLRRDVRLVREARSFRPDLIVTRNPSGTHAARLLGIPSIFDTDDGRASGIHFRMSSPFASVITTPDCMKERYGRRHVTYSGYKELAYLHPDRFRPAPQIWRRLGVEEGEPYSIVRFVDMVASHDRGEGGMPDHVRGDVLRSLARLGPVFVSSEGDPPAGATRFPLAAVEMHDALAQAAIVVGDSQTMAAEAAVFGVPNIRCSSWVGRLDYLEDLEHRWGLTRGFSPDHGDRLVETLEEWIADLASIRTEWTRRREAMLKEKEDVSEWFTGFLLAGWQRVLDRRAT